MEPTIGFDPFALIQDANEVSVTVNLPSSREALGVHFISTSTSRQPRISSFDPNSRAIGMLVLGDKITHVDGIETDGATQTARVIRSSVQENDVQLTIDRREEIVVTLSKGCKQDQVNMSLVHSPVDGLLIGSVHPGGLAANSNLIATPCRVVSINGKRDTCKSVKRAVAALQSRVDPTITVRYGGKPIDTSAVPASALQQPSRGSGCSSSVRTRCDTFDDGLRI